MTPLPTAHSSVTVTSQFQISFGSASAATWTRQAKGLGVIPDSIPLKRLTEVLNCKKRKVAIAAQINSGEAASDCPAQV